MVVGLELASCSVVETEADNLHMMKVVEMEALLS